MQLPALKNSVPASLDGQSIEDFIRNSTQNLQHMAAAMPGSGIAGAVVSRLRRHHRQLEAQQGGGRPEKSRPHPGAAARPVRGLHRVGQRVAAAEDPAAAARRSPTTSRCPSGCCRSRCRPTPTRRKPTARRYVLGFVGFMLDDGANVVFEHYSMGAKKAVNALATAATQALAAFGEIVHPVIELGSSSYENSYRTIYDPKLNVIGYVTDKRAREADVISDDDIITRPTASRAKLRRETKEAPAL